MLTRAVEAAKEDAETPPDVRKRIGEMHRFATNLSGWYDQIKGLPTGVLLKLMSLGSARWRVL